MTVVVNPWMTIAFFLLMLSIVIIKVYALRTMRQVKRLEAKGMNREIKIIWEGFKVMLSDLCFWILHILL